MPDPPGETVAQPHKRRRWGLRVLGCLTVVIAALIVAGEQGYHTPGTFGCVIFGTIGALIFSVRGIRDLLDLEWYRRRLDARRSRAD